MAQRSRFIHTISAALATVTLAGAVGWAATTVKSFSPQGELTDPKRPITVVFSDPMVAPLAVGKKFPLMASPLRIRPTVDGYAVWKDVNKLQFTPQTEFPAATEFFADFGPGGIKDAKGQLLAGQQNFSFNTPALKLEKVSQIGISDNRSTLEFVFSAPISPQRLYGFLSIKDSEGNQISYTVDTKQPQKNLIVTTQSVDDASALTCSLAAGLRPDSGSLGLANTEEYNVKITRQLEIDNSYTNSGRIVFSLTTRVDVDGIKNFIKVKPNVPFRVSNSYGYLYVESDSFVPRSRFTVTLKKGLGGESGLTQDYVKSFVFPDLSADIEFTGTGIFLSPSQEPRIPIQTTNVQDVSISAYRVYDRNLPLVLSSIQSARSGDWGISDAVQWAKLLTTKTFSTNGELNKPVTRAVNLKWFDENPHGLYLLKAENNDEDSYSSTVWQLVCISDMTLSARVYRQGLHLWASHISDTKPVANGTVTVYSSKNLIVGTGTTDADGLVTIVPEEPWTNDTQPSLAVLQKDDDVTLVPLDGDLLSDRGINTDGVPWTDSLDGTWILPRNIWQPGETLQAQALVRNAQALPVPEVPLRWSLKGPNGELSSGSFTLSKLGTASLETALPDAMASGQYSLVLETPGAKSPITVRTIQVEEFRPPQIEVKFVDAPDILVAGEETPINFQSDYLFGAPGSDLQWELSYRAVPMEWTVPQLPGYHFGPWNYRKIASEADRLAEDTLDEDGKGSWTWPEDPPFSSPEAAPMKLNLILSVQEKGGRWSGKTLSVPLLPDKYMVGVLVPESDLRPGVAVDIPLALVDAQGEPASGKVDVKVSRVDSEWVMVTEDGRSRCVWQENLVETEATSVSVDGKGSINYTPDDEGEWQLEFSCGKSRTTIRLCAWKGAQPAALTGPENLTLSTDKESYKDGESAHLTVKSPFAGRLILCSGTDKPLFIKSLDMADTQTTVDVPTDGLIPNGWCVASLVRPEGSKRPYRALGAIAIKKDLTSSLLKVTVNAPEETEPGSFNAVIEAQSADGKPVNGTVTIALVDRGILGMSNTDNSDPWKWFTRLRRLDGSTCDTYDQLMSKLDLGVPALHPAGGDAESCRMAMCEGDVYSPIKAEDYVPTSIWEVDLPMKDGKADVQLDIPEFQGSVRLEAFVAALDGVGRQTERINVARPLMNSVSLPRYLAAGDQFTISDQIFAKEDGPVQLTVKPEALLDASGDPAQTVKVVKGQATVQLPALTAQKSSGTAKLTVQLSQGDLSASQTVSSMLRPAWPHVVLSGGGKTDGESNISMPQEWFPGTGTASVTLCGSPVSDVTKLLEATDGWGSRIQQVIALGWISIGLPQALGDESLTNEEELARKLYTSITFLKALQNYDGSWSYWRGDDSGDIYTTAQVLHLLSAMKEHGVPVDESMISQGTRYLRQSLSDEVPADNAAQKLDLVGRAYACYALALCGDAPLGWMNWLIDQKTLPADGSALLSAAWAVAGDRSKAETILGGKAPSLVDKPNKSWSPALQSLALRLIAHEAIAPGGADARNDAEAIAAALAKDSLYWIDSSTSGLLIAALSSFAEHAGESASSGTLVDSTGKELATFNGSPVTWTGPVDGPLTVKAQGGTLWYSWSVHGVPLNQPAPFAKGIKASLTLTDKNGEKINAQDVKLGQEVILRVTVKANSNSANLRTSVLLPAGLELTEAGEGTTGNVGSLRIDKRLDRVILNAVNATGEFGWNFPCRAVFRGTFIIPPLSVESPANPGIGYLGKADKLVIK